MQGTSFDKNENEPELIMQSNVFREPDPVPDCCMMTVFKTLPIQFVTWFISETNNLSCSRNQRQTIQAPS